MKIIAKKTEKLQGAVTIPSSKSHTIRAVIFASLAKGISRIINPLQSGDTISAVEACRSFGAKIDTSKDTEWTVEGFDGQPKKPDNVVDLGNSGTSLRILTGVASLGDFKVELDGDDSLRKRNMQPLLSALNRLGSEALSVNNDGCPPVEIKGRITGGSAVLDCKSSQYISSLLISCPLAEKDSEIELVNVCEKPYIEMTMRWLDELGIRYENHNFERMRIFGNQRYKAFDKTIPNDWSSATFLLAAGAMLGEELLIKGLDTEDSQADKEVLDYLRKMGANIKTEKDGIRITKSDLKGCELDLNNTPDALPAMAVLGCYAAGETIIKNVGHARIKETDRIKIMAEQLGNMGADIRELEEGLIIRKSRLKAARLKGYSDHRIVMALSLAGLIADGITEIDSAEAINVTFPGYTHLMKSLGALLEEK